MKTAIRQRRASDAPARGTAHSQHNGQARQAPPPLQLKASPLQACACEDEEPMQQRSYSQIKGKTATQQPIQRIFGLELIPEKFRLIRMIADTSWIMDIFNGLDTDAHPRHKAQMIIRMTQIILGRGSQLTQFGRRVIRANSQAELTNIEGEYAAFISTDAPILYAQLDNVVSTYRLIEQMWLLSFMTHSPFEKDPTNLNQSGQQAHLKFQPGQTGTVSIITRAAFTWNLTSGAQAAGVSAWTAAEQANFISMFQTQLDDVWDTSVTLPHAAFRVEEPKDYLLKNESLKWSTLTAHMEGKIQQSPQATAHFNITVSKRTAAESSLRPFVNDGGGQFYADNTQDGYDSSGNQTGAQHTLAHEWLHMIGNPDEYAENSADQSQDWVNNGGTTSNSLGSDQWTACQNTLTARTTDPSLTPAEQNQAAQDLADLRNQYQDSDASTPGSQDRIFNLANRPDIPDGCFAVRGMWSGPRSIRLRPGSRSQRGGTRISMNTEDRDRISDFGNNIHAYHREGILVELNNTLEGQTNPKVQFEHNFEDMSLEEHIETLRGRLNNIHWDLVSLREQLNASGSGGSAPQPVHDDHHHHHH